MSSCCCESSLKRSEGTIPSVWRSFRSRRWRPRPGCLEAWTTCCRRSARHLTCLVSLRMKLLRMASAKALSPDLSADEHSRCRSPSKRFCTNTASSKGPTIPTGPSGQSSGVDPIALGVERPPRETTYLSSHLKSAKHSAAERSQRLFAVRNKYIHTE